MQLGDVMSYFRRSRFRKKTTEAVLKSVVVVTFVYMFQGFGG